MYIMIVWKKEKEKADACSKLNLYMNGSLEVLFGLVCAFIISYYYFLSFISFQFMFMCLFPYLKTPTS